MICRYRFFVSHIRVETVSNCIVEIKFFFDWLLVLRTIYANGSEVSCYIDAGFVAIPTAS